MRRSRILLGLTIAALAVVAPSAQAKVSCEGVHPPAEIRIGGIPDEPIADTEYHASLDVPRAPMANPTPIAMFMRCGATDYPSFTINLPGAGRSGFPLRFSEPGHYRATLMDQGGTFHSLGTIDVRKALDVEAVGAASGATAEPVAGDAGGGGGGETVAIVAGIGLVVAATVLIGLRRRRLSAT